MVSKQSDVKRVERLVALVVANKLDYLEVDGIKIHKTSHHWEQPQYSEVDIGSPPTSTVPRSLESLWGVAGDDDQPLPSLRDLEQSE